MSNDIPVSPTLPWKWERYTEWKKPDIKGHILYDFIYMKYPEYVKFERQNADYWFPGPGGWEGQGMVQRETV